MGKITCWILLCLLLLATPAFPWAMAYEPGKPLQSKGWPEGLNAALESRRWTAAYWCNGFSYFYYTGDAAAINKFLPKDKCSRSEDPASASPHSK